MELDQIDSENLRIARIGRFTNYLALVCVILAAFPALIGWLSAPTGSLYFGIQTNLDDHMVYAAWMRQAMDGQFLFDNRFAVDAQPGLTVHLYFLVLGWIAKLFGIPLTMFLARLGLTFLLVKTLGSFVTKLNVEVFKAKYILMIACFGGGIGFLAWEQFGQEVVNGPEFLKTLFLGLSPIDVWQPEAFIFPSMLTNGLFLVSLCLIIHTIKAVILAKDSAKPVLGGLISFGVLMNIHSYDALLLALVLPGFIGTQIVQKKLTKEWAIRMGLIALGAVPAALWFLHVLQSDPVFQARAATPTYSPNFRQVFFGLLPIMGLGVFSAWNSKSKHRLLSFSLVAALILGLFLLSAGHNPNGYFVSLPIWIILYGFAIAIVCLMASDDQVKNVAWSWAIIGLVAIYFPALFQRKLAMGIIIPWSILAAFGLSQVLEKLDRSTRNLVATLTLCISGGSSLAWFMRELYFIRNDVGRTAVHSVYYSNDTQAIINKLNSVSGRKVVLALPGIWNPSGPAQFKTPIVSDLNAILSGMTGAYSYAGHWSETPEYNKRRSQSTVIYLATTSPEKRAALLGEIKPDYIVAPNIEAFPNIVLGDQRLPLADLKSLGTVVYEGNQWLLIQVAK